VVVPTKKLTLSGVTLEHVSTLTTNKLVKSFGALVAVDEVDFEAETGLMYGIIGPNGAGKTTFIRCLTGKYKPSSGSVEYEGERIDDLEEFLIARRGIATAEQLVSIYPDITVYDNVATALHAEREERLWDGLFQTSRHDEEVESLTSRVEELLETVGLRDRMHDEADTLAYGQKKRLMIAMSIASEPDFLILDEPVAGLNPEESAHVMDIMNDLIDSRDLGILLIEHDMDVVMDNCDRITVLSNGQKIAEGEPAEIQQNDLVKEAYLG
jgi:branched-chain amino acid transport system ATP-binding protein